MSASSTGLPSNIAAPLAYLFGFLGGIVLLIVERRDPYVRFHAAQSTLAFLTVFALTLLCASLPVVGRLLSNVIYVGTIVMWLLLMVKAFQGERFKLPVVGEIAERQIR